MDDPRRYPSSIFIAAGVKKADWANLAHGGWSRWPSSKWNTAISWFVKRFEDRYFAPLERLQDSQLKFSGFGVLSIACPLLETLEQFYWGRRSPQAENKAFYVGGAMRLLKGELTATSMAPVLLAAGFYENVRCGIAHQCELKGTWTVGRGHGAVVTESNDIFAVDHVRLVQVLRTQFDVYVALLKDDPKAETGVHVLADEPQIVRYRRKPEAVPISYGEAVRSFATNPKQVLRENFARRMSRIAAI